MNPLLRPAKVSDTNALKNFQQKLVIHERPFDSEIPGKGNVEYYDIKKLIKSDNANFLVVEIGNKIVGCGFGQIRKSDDWAVNEKYGYIGLVFVDKKYRRQNIGKLIIDALIKWFIERNISDIRLKVYEKNFIAVSAYRKYGFKNFILEMRYDPITRGRKLP